MKNFKVVYLKVKIKSLQEEAKIIRKFEKQYKKNDDLRNGLCEHRKGIVRDEQFHTFLAYAYLRGKTFQSVAPGCNRKITRSKVADMVWRYGDVSSRVVIDENLKKWFMV